MFGNDPLNAQKHIVNVAFTNNLRGFGGEDFLNAPKYRRYASSLDSND